MCLMYSFQFVLRYNGTRDAPAECAEDYTGRLFKFKKCYWYIPGEVIDKNCSTFFLFSFFNTIQWLFLLPNLNLYSFCCLSFLKCVICPDLSLQAVYILLSFSTIFYICYRKMDAVICNYSTFHNCDFAFSIMYTSDQNNSNLDLIGSSNKIVICPQ